MSPPRHDRRRCRAVSSTSRDADRGRAPSERFRLTPATMQGQRTCRSAATKLLRNAGMAEILVMLPDVLAAEDGQTYVARAVGAETPLRQWEAWIEFVPLDGGASATSPRETTQPNRVAAVYWASGLTAIYLEGALARALGRNHRAAAASLRNATAPATAAANRRAAAPARRPAVLDP